jgi:hypothetical protein
MAKLAIASLTALGACDSSDSERVADRPAADTTANAKPRSSGTDTNGSQGRAKDSSNTGKDSSGSEKRASARTLKRRNVRPPEGGPAPPPAPTGHKPGNTVRVPVALVVVGNTVGPAQVAAPSGSPLELVLTAADARAHQVSLETPAPRSFRVPARGHARFALAPLRPGRYRVKVDGRPGPATVVVYPYRSRE